MSRGSSFVQIVLHSWRGATCACGTCIFAAMYILAATLPTIVAAGDTTTTVHLVATAAADDIRHYHEEMTVCHAAILLSSVVQATPLCLCRRAACRLRRYRCCSLWLTADETVVVFTITCHFPESCCTRAAFRRRPACMPTFYSATSYLCATTKASTCTGYLMVVR